MSGNLTYKWYAKVHNWEQAAEWLSKGRDKNRRPLYHMSLHVKRLDPSDPNSSIAVGYYNTWKARLGETPEFWDVVVYHKDNTATVTHNSQWASARRASCYYANLTGLYRRNGELWLRQDNDKPKKAYTRPCSKCHGMMTNMYMDDLGVVQKVRCGECTDGQKRSKQGYFATKIPQQRITLKCDDNRYYASEYPAAFRVDTNTGFLIGFESNGIWTEIKDVRSKQSIEDKPIWVLLNEWKKEGKLVCLS